MKEPIAKLRILLAQRINKYWKSIPPTSNIFNPPHGFYWTKTFIDPKRGVKVKIFFQRYVRGFKKMRPNYARLTFPELQEKELSREDMEVLLNDLTKN